MPVLTRLQEAAARSAEQVPLTTVEQSVPSGMFVSNQAGKQLKFEEPMKTLQKTKVTVLMRRSVYFLITGMLVYLLSWSSVICRVTRGIVRYPDKIPTFVWVLTLGILLFYETFVIAQCTSMTARVKQIMAAQRPSLPTKWSTDEFAKCTVLRAFYVQACGLKSKRDTIYLSLLHFLSMPDWESIAFLAGGATVDLVSAVLYSVPALRKDFFGLPEKEQLNEPWATMTFLLLVWLLTVSAAAMLEKYRHRKGKQLRTVPDADTPYETAWDYDEDTSMQEQLDKKLGQLMNQTSPSPFTNGMPWLSCTHAVYKCFKKLAECKKSPESDTETIDNPGTQEANATQTATAQGLLNSWNGMRLKYKLLIAFLIYIGIGGTIFIGWGFLMKAWINGPTLPWIIGLITLSVLLFREMYLLGRWRLKVHHNETPDRMTQEQISTRMSNFAKYHKYAALFHLGLIAMSLSIGTANTDLNWAHDYIGLRRPTYFMTTDYKRMIDISDNKTLKDELIADATNSSDPFLGLQGATKPKISIDYCATSYPLNIYFLLICIGWSVCSALQHVLTWYRIGQFKTQQCIKCSWFEYSLVILASLFLITFPAIIRYGFGWQVLLLQTVLGPIVMLAVQVAGIGVFDLFDDADDAVPTESDLTRDAKLAIRDVRAYKWIEYTVSATLMHCVVVYFGGVLSAHELFLSVGLLAVSMLFCNLSDSVLHQAEQADASCGRLGSVITVDQLIDAEMPFIFLSFFAKGVLSIALTVPWVFVSRTPYVTQPVECA